MDWNILEKNSPDFMMTIESLWWHMQVNPTTKQRPNIIHMKGSALPLFGQCH
jgi:hypothetical protein